MCSVLRIQWKDLRRRDVLWRLLLITLLLVLVSGGVFLFSVTQGVIPRHVSVTIDTNGVPAILGVRLANTNIRSAAFYSLRILGIKPLVRISNDEFLQELSLLRRSGLGTNVNVMIAFPSPALPKR
jgi:hypothetical protein